MAWGDEDIRIAFEKSIERLTKRLQEAENKTEMLTRQVDILKKQSERNSMLLESMQLSDVYNKKKKGPTAALRKKDIETLKKDKVIETSRIIADNFIHWEYDIKEFLNHRGFWTRESFMQFMEENFPDQFRRTHFNGRHWNEAISLAGLSPKMHQRWWNKINGRYNDKIYFHFMKIRHKHDAVIKEAKESGNFERFNTPREK